LRILGIDLGSVRIGVAMSDGTATLASPLVVVNRSKRRSIDHAAIKRIVDEWEVERIVVGLPLSLDGSVGTAASAALAEADELGVATGVPVETYDERLTTVSAHQILREQGVAGPDRRARVDMVAAAVLLQAWLDGQSADGPDDGDPRPPDEP
jgi:putative Holliday junction resolvase